MRHACVLASALAVVLGGPRVGEPAEGTSGVYTLSVRLLSSSAPLEGPVPLELRVSYNGDRKAMIASLKGEHLDLAIQAPKEWIPMKRRRPRVLSGEPQVHTLHRGDEVSRIIYLHDFFSKLAPGTAELLLTLRIWPEAGQARIPVVLRRRVVVRVARQDPKALDSRIHGVFSKIRTQVDVGERIRMYRSLQGVFHPSLIRVFLHALKDPQALGIHESARHRVVRLCKKHGNWQPVLDYLASHGSRADRVFFQNWKRSGTRFTREQLERLSHAPSLWVRLYAIELYAPGSEVRGLVDSLAAEARQLVNEIEALKQRRDQ